MTVLVMLDLQTKPERTADCIEYLRGIVADSRTFPGMVSLATVRDTADAAHLMLIEQWDSPKDQQAYLQWRAETDMLGEMLDFIVEPPTIRAFDYSPGV